MAAYGRWFNMSTVKTNRIEQVGNTSLPLNVLPVTSFAWVRFNGVGTVSIDGTSVNVASITDAAVGSYVVNFITPPAANTYAVWVNGATGGGAGNVYSVLTTPGTGPTVVSLSNTDGSTVDSSNMTVLVFGERA